MSPPASTAVPDWGTVISRCDSRLPSISHVYPLLCRASGTYYHFLMRNFPSRVPPERSSIRLLYYVRTFVIRCWWPFVRPLFTHVSSVLSPVRRRTTGKSSSTKSFRHAECVRDWSPHPYCSLLLDANRHDTIRLPLLTSVELEAELERIWTESMERGDYYELVPRTTISTLSKLRRTNRA